MPRHSKKGDGCLKALAALLAVAALALGLCAYVLVAKPDFAAGLLQVAGEGAAEDASGRSASRGFDGLGDALPTEAQEAAERELHDKLTATPLMASCSGVDLHSAVAPADLTGILFHQASYGYALTLDTEIPEADYERVEAERSMRIDRDQTEGTWLNSEALHLWRTTDATAMETSIDVGGRAGTTVLAPVDGTVVLVRDYMLYDEMADIEIHIQPTGRSDLDCVLIHTTDPLVKAGDAVTGGVTPLSRIRDIEAQLTDVQLSFFTPEGVGGNHVHVQVNDANYEGYREERLKGAVKAD